MAETRGILSQKDIDDYSISYLRYLKATRWDDINDLLKEKIDLRLGAEITTPLPSELNITYFTTLGHYFEYCIYCAYCNLVKEINSHEYTIEEVERLLNSSSVSLGSNFDFSAG